MPSSFFSTPRAQSKKKRFLFDILIYAQILREQSFFGEEMHWRDKTDSPLTGHTFLQGVCVYDVSIGQISSFCDSIRTKSPIQSQPLCISLNWTVTVHVRGASAVVGKKN